MEDGRILRLRGVGLPLHHLGHRLREILVMSAPYSTLFKRPYSLEINKLHRWWIHCFDHRHWQHFHHPK